MREDSTSNSTDQDSGAQETNDKPDKGTRWARSIAPVLNGFVDTTRKAGELAGNLSRSVAESKGTANIAQAVKETPSNLLASAQQSLELGSKWWQGEDPDEIIHHNRFLQRYAQSRILPLHAAHALLAAGVASGTLASEDILMRSTRALMDNDAGVVQQAWRQVFPNDNLSHVVSSGMDQVPGAARSGGMFHRLEHGHDLEALLQIVEEHGLGGAAEWFNHILLRDFWTPHGVPFLPTGSSGMFDWLVSHGVKKTVAADLLAVNAAEFFAGLFYARAVHASWQTYQKITLQHELKAAWQRAMSFDKEENHEAGINAYDHITRLADADDSVRILVSLAHLQAATLASEVEGRVMRANAAYLQAMAVLGGGGADKEVRLNGAQVSVRGLAGYVVAASASPRSAANDPGELDERYLRSSVRAFEATAERLSHRRQLARPERPYSALINELLALELRYGLSEHASMTKPIELRERALNMLARIVEKEERRSSPRDAFLARVQLGVAGTYPVH